MVRNMISPDCFGVRWAFGVVDRIAWQVGIWLALFVRPYNQDPTKVPLLSGCIDTK